MSLTWKLILSHLIVIAVGLLVLGLSTAFVAPANFSQRMNDMQGTKNDSTRGIVGSTLQAYIAVINVTYRQSLNNALLITGFAATVVAVALSWYTSRRIVRPIRGVVKASQYIAAGHYNERLVADQQDEIGELTRSFNRMAVALADTETMRQQLIGDVGHELKTPLASIKGYMEGLQDGVIPATPETFQLVHHEADRLQRLVSDLQALSRAEAHQVPMDFQPCNAVDLVNTAVAALRPQYEEKEITLETDLPSDAPIVRADRDRIRQVLVNLLGNALQYTPSGERVIIRLRLEDDKVHLSVQDTGTGLNIVDLERVFQRFYRVDKSRSRASGGSGIGLTIARHIVEAHHGRIWAESAGPNQGSTFHFTLPLA
jgi:two-component system sensor histidine kinase BaeS